LTLLANTVNFKAMVQYFIMARQIHLLLHWTVFESQRLLAIHANQMVMVMIKAASLKLQSAVHEIELLQDSHLAKHSKIAIHGIEAHARVLDGHLVVDVLRRQISLIARKYLHQRSALVGDPPAVPCHRIQHFLTLIVILHRSPIPFLIVALISYYWNLILNSKSPALRIAMNTMTTIGPKNTPISPTSA
jgi:hypothetical protein